MQTHIISWVSMYRWLKKLSSIKLIKDGGILISESFLEHIACADYTELLSTSL